MKYKLILFDLDDTLYNEFEYVKSGFKKVAEYLNNLLCFDESNNDIYNQMIIKFHENGRGKVFNDILQDLDLSEKKYLTTLIYIYRNHKPSNLLINPEMEKLIKKIKDLNIKVGIITDGIYVTQKNKTNQLLSGFIFNVVIHTDSLGNKCWKPSPEPFKVAKNITGIEEGVYIGDNPVKDFKGANMVGFESVWWNPVKSVFGFKDNTYKPTYECHNITQLNKVIFDE